MKKNTLKSPGFQRWENEIILLIEEQAEVTRSDAQGILQVHEDKIGNWYNAGTPEQGVVDIILSQPTTPNRESEQV